MKKISFIFVSLITLILIFAPYSQTSPKKPQLKTSDPKVSSTLEKAKRLAERGELESARREFEKAVKQHPNNDDARKGLTEVLLRLGKLDEALRHLQWLSKKETNNFRLWATLGQVLERKGLLDEAKQALIKAVHLQPNEPEFRVHLSRVLLGLGQWDESAHHWRWLAKRIPNLASVQYHLALYYEHKGNLSKALYHARKTVQLSPKEPNARLLLARLSVQLNDFKTAAKQMKFLSKFFPTDVRLALECAKLFVHANDTANAIYHFRRALHLRFDLPDVHRFLADLYSERGQWEKALWHVRWLLKGFPNDVDVVRAEAQCYVKLKRFQEAKSSLLKWVKLQPQNFEPFLKLAILYEELGNQTKASESYRQAIKRRPPIEVIAEAADFEKRSGNFEQASNLYEKLQRRQPENPTWRVLRVESLMRNRQIDRAGRILRSALKKFPDHPHLNALMGLYHAKRVEWIEAEDFLKKAVEKLKLEGNFERPLEYEAIGSLLEIWQCQGKAKEALELSETLLRTHASQEILIWWAQAMDELGKTKLAAMRLQRSKAYVNGDERVVKATAKLWELLDRPSKAVAIWEQFASMHKEQTRKINAWLNASQVWERANNIPKALSVLDKAIAITNHSLNTNQRLYLLSERIRLLLEAQAFTVAFEETNKLLDIYPDRLTVASLCAESALGLWKDLAFDRLKERFERETKLAGALILVAERLNLKTEAEKILTETLKRLKGYERMVVIKWLNYWTKKSENEQKNTVQITDWAKAKSEADKGRIDTALFYCRKIIAKHRDFLPAYELMLQLYQTKGNLKVAVKGFTQLANRQRDDVTINAVAGMACSMDKQYRRAVGYFRRVCALTDNAPDAMLKLAESLQGARQESQAYWVHKFLKRLDRWSD